MSPSVEDRPHMERPRAAGMGVAMTSAEYPQPVHLSTLSRTSPHAAIRRTTRGEVLDRVILLARRRVARAVRPHFGHRPERGLAVRCRIRRVPAHARDTGDATRARQYRVRGRHSTRRVVLLPCGQMPTTAALPLHFTTSQLHPAPWGADRVGIRVGAVPSGRCWRADGSRMVPPLHVTPTAWDCEVKVCNHPDIEMALRHL